MDSVRYILRRGDSNAPRPMMATLVVVALSLISAGLLLVGVLALIRRVARQRQQSDLAVMEDGLPAYREVERTRNNARQLTIHAQNGRSSVVVYNNGSKPMLLDHDAPPASPTNVPQIHITFPDEQDEQGQRKSGRVVVVHVGDNAVVGLEPLHNDHLPAYEKENKSQFHSIDLDKIGGLREKERPKPGGQ